MRKRELEQLKKALLSERERIHQDLSRLQEENLNKNSRDFAGEISGLGTHIADVADQDYNRGFILNLVSGKQKQLEEIDRALDKIEEGDYGQCENCGGPIDVKRLKARPGAIYCLECREQLEKEEAI